MRRKHIKVIYRNLSQEKVWGLADDVENLITLDTTLKGKKHLEILLHEAMHVLNPSFEEEQVEFQSIALTNLLWKELYRRIEKDEKTPLQDGKK